MGCIIGGVSGFVVSNESSFNLVFFFVEDFLEKEFFIKVN